MPSTIGNKHLNLLSWTFECEATFDMESLTYSHHVIIKSSRGKTIFEYNKNTPANVMQNGFLDAKIDVGDGIIKNLNTISFTDLLKEKNSLADYEKSYYILTNEATLLQSQTNYDYNKALEDAGNGVKKGNYVYDQTDTRTDGYKAGNYRFGFWAAKFKDVGCEIAACYNIAIALGKAEALSKTVQYAEKNLKIDFMGGKWGCLPRELGEYFSHKGLRYIRVGDDFDEFEAEVLKREKCKIVFSRWNDGRNGLHTFYINKLGSRNYRGYNHISGLNGPESKKEVLRAYKDGNDFIVGFIVWK